MVLLDYLLDYVCAECTMGKCEVMDSPRKYAIGCRCCTGHAADAPPARRAGT